MLLPKYATLNSSAETGSAEMNRVGIKIVLQVLLQPTNPPYTQASPVRTPQLPAPAAPCRGGVVFDFGQLLEEQGGHDPCL